MSHLVSHTEQRNQKHSINLCNHERYPGHLKCLKNIQKIKYPDFQAMTPTIPESHEKDTDVHHNSPSDHQTQPQEELGMILEEEKQEVEEQPDPADQDTLVFEFEESEE